MHWGVESMELDQKIEWAEKISRELHSVRRNEFRNWLEYYQQKDLDSALKYAQRLSHSKMLRSQQKKALNRIFYGIRKYKSSLDSMSKETILDIFGYVIWGLHLSLGGDKRSS
jgi:uncharacterized protein Usg